jgi:excisionase family DNA binding protein
MAVPTDRTFLTAEQAAREAGCSSAWIRRLLKRGDLPGIQMGGWTWVIDKEDLDRVVTNNLTSRAVSKRDAEPKEKKSRKKAG